MAHFHFEIKNIKKGNALNYCELILNSGTYQERENIRPILYTETINLPEWAQTTQEFFAAADKFERKNGNAAQRIELALQNELTLEQNIETIHELINMIISRDKVILITIKKNEKNNIYAYIYYNEKCITDTKNIKEKELFFKRYIPQNPPKGGYQKDRRFADGPKRMHFHLLEYRQIWANIVNNAFQQNNIDAQISSLSIKTKIKNALENGDYKTAEELQNKTKREYVATSIYKKVIKIIDTNSNTPKNIYSEIETLLKNENYQKHKNKIWLLVKSKLENDKKEHSRNL